MITQISVFIENEPGRAAHLTNVLTEAGVNIRGYMISDTSDYGIVRLVVDDPDEACRILHSNSAICRQSEVLVVKLDDTPGELSRLFQVFADNDINMTYSYSLISTFVAIQTPDPKDAGQALEAAGFELITQQDLSEGACGPAQEA